MGRDFALGLSIVVVAMAVFVVYSAWKFEREEKRLKEKPQTKATEKEV